MVTRRVIRISPPRKEAQDEKTSSSAAAAAAAVVDSLNNKSDDDTVTKTESNQKPKAVLCNQYSCTRRAQHPSPLCWMHCALARDVTCKYSGCKNKGILLGLCPDHGGLVQLCRWRGCINEANLEKRGGLCWMHQARGKHEYDDDSSEEEEEDVRLCRFRGCISLAATDDELCDMHAPNHDNSGMNKKRVYASEHSSDNDTGKRQRMNAFVIDLTDVPPQPPIPKCAGRLKEGASKYTGVSFVKATKNWVAQIMIDGEHNRIGLYASEEEAAVDYARAAFKYKGPAALDRERGRRELDKARVRHSFVIDLSDVPLQSPILKSAGRKREGTSKYTGVSFDKSSQKWVAQIMIDGKQNRIGLYGSEEEAATDYARASFKYKPDDWSRRQNQQNKFIIDLKDVLPQPLILKNALLHSKEYNDNTRRRNIRKGSSKYTGIYFEKGMKKWKAQIMIEGIVRSIGYYETEEEAAADYARAAFKYKPKRGYATYGGLDLKDVPDQPLIHSDTSKSGFKGVKKNKNKKRWEASLNGQNLGTFDTKEEAAGIYARARFYVDKGGELPKKKEQEAATTVLEESIDLVAV